MRPPKTIYSEIPSQLLEKIKQGNSIFYIGSNILSPPRYKFTEEIMKLAEIEDPYRKLEQESRKPGSNTRVVRDIPSEGIFKEVKEFMRRKWPEPSSTHHSIAKLRTVKSIITTLFDTYLEDVSREYRPVNVLTGIGIVNNEKNLSSYERQEGDDLLIYKLLGDIAKPETLFISENMMKELGGIMLSSGSNAGFMKDLVRDKILVVVGYDDRDDYDNFFPALLNNITYSYKESILEDIYVVDTLQYYSSYGSWAGKDESEMNYVNMEASKFLTELVKAVGDT